LNIEFTELNQYWIYGIENTNSFRYCVDSSK